MDSSSQLRARIEQAQEREEQLRRNRERETIDKVFAESEVRFKIGNEQVLSALGTIQFDADGQPMNGGKPLEERLRDYAEINGHAVSGTVEERHDQGKSSVRSRADFASDADRVAYIRAFGDLAYARLPQTTPETRTVEIDALTWTQYIALPDRERARIAGLRGAGFISRLKHAHGEQERNARLAGIPRK